MWNRCIAGAIVVIVSLAVSACASYGTGPAEYSTTNDTGFGATGGTEAGGSVSGGKDKAARGGTMSGAGGSTSASTPAPSGPGEKEDQRGNTPPGVSRDGAGPAAGAIVDPTGSVTKGK
jgi:hypothetical protein